MKTYKITAADFDLFMGEFRHWQNKLGLLDWNVCFDWEKLEDAQANINYQCVDRIATVRLAKTLLLTLDASAEQEIKRSALHEVLELLLGDLYDLTPQRENERKVLHQIIRRLETVLEEKDE